jgi:hypothetical protein
MINRRFFGEEDPDDNSKKRGTELETDQKRLEKASKYVNESNEVEETDAEELSEEPIGAAPVKVTDTDSEIYQSVPLPGEGVDKACELPIADTETDGGVVDDDPIASMWGAGLTKLWSCPELTLEWKITRGRSPSCRKLRRVLFLVLSLAAGAVL